MSGNRSSIASLTCTYAFFINTNDHKVDGRDHATANGEAAGSIPMDAINASSTHQTQHTAVFYYAQIHGLNTTHPPFAAAPFPPSTDVDSTSTGFAPRFACRAIRKMRSNPLTTFLTIFGVGIALWGIILSLQANNLSQNAVDRTNFSITLQDQANKWAELAISWAYWSYNAAIVGNRIDLMGLCVADPNAFGCAAVKLWSGEKGYLQNALVDNLNPDRDNSSAPKPTSLPLAEELPEVLPRARHLLDTAGGIAVTATGVVSAFVLLGIVML